MYISRTLIADLGRQSQRSLSEQDVVLIKSPIVILGDPGLGKTELTKSLSAQTGYLRIAGGTFYRIQSIDHLKAAPGLIIDGIDEITTPSGTTAIDEVLKKLSLIDNPHFILSCRSADWLGSTDKYKISSDYGVEPITLHLQPFNSDDAKNFLRSFLDIESAKEVLDDLEQRDFGEFFSNPLTLTLVAELVSTGRGLPKNKADLFDRATELLTSERNPAHQRSAHALVNFPSLLDSAGAVFAHLLLSGSLGVSVRNRSETTDGYIPVESLDGILDAAHILDCLKTRLFQSADENLLIPFHKVIAEYLGARWLAKRLLNGLSERRLFQILTFADGVPTAFRGIHAWVAHFAPWLTIQCIKNDPYGILRYGETDQLSVEHAKQLLIALSLLAREDPYFRNEDWGKRAVSGLARPALKKEIVDLLKSPDKHTHLSTLILEALHGSDVTTEIAGDLLSILEDRNSIYVERFQAVEALVSCKAEVDWPTVVRGLEGRPSNADKRLILEIITATAGIPFSGDRIAEAILDYKISPKRSLESAVEDNDDEASDDDDQPYVSGMVYGITRRISSTLSGEILDALVRRLMALNKPAYWKPGFEIVSGINQLLEKAIENDTLPTPDRAWSWLRFADADRNSSTAEVVKRWLEANPFLRRAIQEFVLTDAVEGDAVWAAIVHDLPSANRALALSLSDVEDLLTDRVSLPELSSEDVLIWSSLVQCTIGEDGVPQSIKPIVEQHIRQHPALDKEYKRISARPRRDWKKQEAERREVARRKQDRKFAKHRASFWPVRDQISRGEDIASLNHLASAYLGRFSDLDNDAAPDDRLRQWLGDVLAEAALKGFVAALSRSDIPSVSEISRTHANSKIKLIESIIICGVSELVRAKLGLSSISLAVSSAALAAWWEFPDFNAKRLGEEIQLQLERAVLSAETSAYEFLRSVMEPRIQAGHEYVPGLHRLGHEEQFRPVVGKLALHWLSSFPEAHINVQWELLQLAYRFAAISQLRRLIESRLVDDTALRETQNMWMSAAFLIDFEERRDTLRQHFHNDKNTLWDLSKVVQFGQQREGSATLTVAQLEFAVQMFSKVWPPVNHPTSSWGDRHPWQATDFIRSCVNGIGAIASKEATDSLERLSQLEHHSSYADQVKHVRSQQLRLRRDTEHRVRNYVQIKQTLLAGLPSSVDDLKAEILDKLESVQDYLRNGDTDAWEAFWNRDLPKDENTCRHRLLDLIRPRLSQQISLLPETLMPENTRADIVALLDGMGLPIEIKGQWHPKLWDAASVQLIQKYARDWRADDRGIYLVLWFGDVSGKRIVGHPEGLDPPASPRDLCQMLLERLPEPEKARIAIVVIDVSKPLKFAS